MNNKDIQSICSLREEWHPGNIKLEKTGGQTNRNWIVDYKGERFFVRLPWQMAGIVDRQVESQNVLALMKNDKASKITPRVHLYLMGKKNILGGSSEYNLPDGAMVTDYIEGKDIDGKDLEDPEIQSSLVKTLYNFHSSGVKFVNPYDVFQNEVDKYKEKALGYEVSQLIDKEKIKRIEEIEREAKKNLQEKSGISTHNDLIFENLRLSRDKKVFLLDFEYAGFNIRDGLNYDIGIILGGNLFQENPISFESYEKKIKKASSVYNKDFDFQEVLFGALTNILVMFWWGLVKYFNSEDKEEKDYFEKYATERSVKITEIFELINKKRGVI